MSDMVALLNFYPLKQFETNVKIFQPFGIDRNNYESKNLLPGMEKIFCLLTLNLLINFFCIKFNKFKDMILQNLI